MASSNLVLPYAVDDGSREKRFSEGIEVAALLCLAEAERKKKTGFFGGAAEVLTALSKLHYPLWAIPFASNCLLLDGMENVAYNISYFKPPEVETFTEDLKRSATALELYQSALRSHSKTFSEFTSQTEIPIKGFISDKKLLADVSPLIQDSLTKMTSTVDLSSLIPPKIDEKRAVAISEELLKHYNRIQSETKGLQFAIDTVSEETKVHVSKLQQELEQTREEYEEKISEVTVEVDKRKEELEKEQREKTGKITATNEKEVNARVVEKNRWERELQRLQQKKGEYESRKELRKRKGDDVGEARWNTRLRGVQSQISTVQRKIKTLSNFIDRTNRKTEKTKKKLRDTYQKLVDKEEKKITDLENLRDSEVGKKQGKIDELQRETLAIINKIDRLIEKKRLHSSTLDEATIPWKIEIPILIHVPFYLARYEAGKKRRYRLHLPVVARSHEGLVMKIRKTLRSYSLQSKIGTLMKPRFKALKKVLAPFEEKMNSDRRVQRAVDQLSESHNLLTSADFKEKGKKWMKELEDEGWIKPEEATAMLDKYMPN